MLRGVTPDLPAADVRTMLFIMRNVGDHKRPRGMPAAEAVPGMSDFSGDIHTGGAAAQRGNDGGRNTGSTGRDDRGAPVASSPP